MATTTHVARPPERGFTPEMEAVAENLIRAGKSTTHVFRALGYKSANRLYSWLKDKPELQAILRTNANAYRASMGQKYKECFKP